MMMMMLMMKRFFKHCQNKFKLPCPINFYPFVDFATLKVSEQTAFQHENRIEVVDIRPITVYVIPIHNRKERDGQ